MLIPLNKKNYNSVKVFQETEKLHRLNKNIVIHSETVLNEVGVSRFLINVVFVNYVKIRELNKQYLEHDYPTDVLAFALNDDNDELEGEIYICPEVAEAQAAEFNITLKEEIIRLVTHGILHLIGYDDQAETDRKTMEEKCEYYVGLFMNN